MDVDNEEGEWDVDTARDCTGHWSMQDADVAREEGNLEEARVHAEEERGDALMPASITDKLPGARVAVTDAEAAGAALGRGVSRVPPAGPTGGRCP